MESCRKDKASQKVICVSVDLAKDYGAVEKALQQVRLVCGCGCGCVCVWVGVRARKVGWK